MQATVPVAVPEASGQAQPAPITVLYIAGWQRSGSTLLANILGQIEGFFSTGELYSLWDFVWRRNILCGCGARFRECPVWGEVVRAAYGEEGAVDAAWMRQSALRAGSTRRLPWLYFEGLRERVVPRDYLENVGRLYAALARTTGSSVIVDSSKWPSYARMLDMLPGIELKVVHLVRDPRAVAHSWLRRTHLPDRAPDEPQDYMYRTPTDSSLHWGAWNVATEAFFGGRLLRLRYEDFARRPLASVRRILDFLGARPRRLPFASDRDVELSPTHTVAGNPVRLRSGKLHIAEDGEWRSRMCWRDAWWVTLLTLPLLYRYGYLGRDGRAES
jgi:hypothetical protein